MPLKKRRRKPDLPVEQPPLHRADAHLLLGQPLPNGVPSPSCPGCARASVGRGKHDRRCKSCIEAGIETPNLFESS